MICRWCTKSHDPRYLCDPAKAILDAIHAAKTILAAVLPAAGNLPGASAAPAQASPAKPAGGKSRDADAKRLWTHQEVADFLGIPAQTLHQQNSKGTGPRSYKIGRHRRYEAADIAAWIETRRSHP